MRFSIGLIASALIGGCTSLVQVNHVSIRDEKFDVVKELDPAELSVFQQQWSEKVITNPTLSEVGGLHFKLDIGCGDTSERWLYQTSGHIQKLSKQDSPVYKLPNPEAFNRLIGANK